MMEQTITTPEHDHNDPPLKDLPITLKNLPRLVILLFIRAHQIVVSPTLPPNTCCYYPTCSHYGYQAVYKYGAIKGSWMAFRRVLRCNPFSQGGYDPVP
jgi:hypothetical protein